MKNLALLAFLVCSFPAFASGDEGLLQDAALSRLERCQDEARIQKGFLPGENTNGVCALRFTGSREGTRACPGTLVFWTQTCRFEGSERGQTCCE